MLTKTGNAPLCFIALLGFALLAARRPAEAQTITATVLGVVTDASGSRVPQAAVTALNVLTGARQTVESNAAGDYIFTALPVGEYRIETKAAGFKRYARAGIKLDVNQSARVDILLEVGDVSQEVVVSADAPLVDANQSQVGNLVDSQRINDLPLNGRNVYDLFTLLPGVTGSRTSAQADQTQGTQLNVNGSRTLQTTFLLDGGINNSVWRNGGNQAPNPDTVQEFRLMTSNYSAEYGRSAGGVVSIITKSGTNQFHGSLFEFVRNDAFDARNFFQPTVNKLRQNQFGGSLGGPIRKDKLFFLFSYQGHRVRSSQFVNAARTPTTAQRGGDFSTAAANQRPRDPDTGVAFPGGIIPASRLDPVAQNLLKFIALPNTPDGRVEASRGTSEQNDQYFAKGDYQINPVHKLTSSMFVIRGDSIYPFTGATANTNIPDYAPLAAVANQTNLSASETWTIGPTLLNQFQFSWASVYDPQEYLKRFGWRGFGSQYEVGAFPERPPQFTVSGGWNAGGSGDFIRYDQNYDWSDTFTTIRSNHVVKAGGMALYQRTNEVGNWLGSGMVGITGAFTGNSFADLLMGRAATFRENNGTNRHYTSKNWSLFLQDDWKLTRRITLNLGLRYEIFTPFISDSDQFQTFQFNRQSRVIPNAPLGLLYPGDPGISRGLVNTDYNNFAPRIGVAIDPTGRGRTAIRAGYGIFFSTGFAGLAYSNLGQPFLVDVTAFGTPNFVQPFANFPGGSPFPVATDFKNPRFFPPVTATWMNQAWATPYVQQYNFTIQQQLLNNLGIELGYVGNTSRKLNLQRDANQPVFTPGRSTAANIDSRRPYLPGVFSLISDAQTAANANYNALQFTVNRRFSRGFTLLSNYTFAKAIDLQSADQQSNSVTAFVDSNNLALDRAISNTNLKHALNFSFLWALPKTNRWGFFGKGVLSGWQLNGIGRYVSGRVFTVTTGQDTNLDGVNNDRPNLLGDPRLDTGRSRSELIAKFFNPAAFQSPPSGSLGTAGRNILSGPGTRNWDLSIFRTFPVLERQRIEFRAEFFNAFNLVSFGNPVSVLSNANFGRILGAASPRIMQFGLKYSF